MDQTLSISVEEKPVRNLDEVFEPKFEFDASYHYAHVSINTWI